MEAHIKSELGDKLYQACFDGNLETVKSCVEGNPASPPPYSAMMYTAASKDNSNIIQYCLANGGKVTDDVMKSILINRAKQTYLLLLREKAADVNHYIPWFGDILSNVATDDDLEWAQLCLSQGADPNRNLVDEHKTILAAAAELASVEMVKLLLANGAKLPGSGAIVLAAEEGRAQMVQFLLDQGADIDEIGVRHPTDERVTEDMGSALHKAVQGGHEEVAKLLISRGANVDLRDVQGRTPSKIAEQSKDPNMLELLNGPGEDK